MASGHTPPPIEPTRVLGAAPHAGDAPAPGDGGGRVGPWRLLHPVGEGGMGVVWLAERADDAFTRRAAVKVIRPGFESAALRERFLQERQTLAALEHPHIARLLDAGTTGDGRPYFVMEFVEGLAIDEWVRTHTPPLDRRIDVFLQVCDAVQHAHGRLVVHRDLKPSNILVDAGGQVRLLDFGIAKLLPATDATQVVGLTSASERLLTPQYAAPEQVMGDPVGTPADIYALGMLLYVLLADALPYSLAGVGPAEMQRLVCDQVPPRPSERCRDTRRARALRGDLDLITLMALRKEPARRYQTVEQFAADLRRWRDGQPVLARPDTAGYRLRKFVGRNRLALAAAGLVFASLVGGLTAALWQAREAERARAVAEQRYRDMRGLATSMMFDVDAAIATLPGSTKARQLVVTRALEHLDRLGREVGTDPALLADLAAGYGKIADIQASPFEANLGDHAGALANARRALALREQAAALATPDDTLVAARARSHLQLGTLLRQGSGQAADALPEFRQAIALLDERGDAPAAGPIALARADALNLLGDALLATQDAAGADAAHAQAITVAENALAASPADAEWQRIHAVSRLREASALWWVPGPPDEVIARMTAATQAFEALLAADPGNARLTRQAAIANSTLASVIAYERAVGESQPYLARAIALGERLLAFDPRNPQSRRDMARWQLLLAEHHDTVGAWPEADAQATAALALMDGLVADDPGQRDLWREARNQRCQRASLRLRGQRAGATGEAFTREAACAAARACVADLADTAFAAPDLPGTQLQDVRDLAGRCPAG